MFHYVYKIKFETGHIYYGVRSCKCKPCDDNYVGSPKTHKNYWKDYKYKKYILSEFDSRKEAEEAERFLINWQWNSTDNGKLLSLNSSITNVSFNMLGTIQSNEHKLKRSKALIGIKRSQETKTKLASVFAKPYKMIDPNGRIIEGKNLNAFCRKNNLKKAAMSSVVLGKNYQHKGYRKYNENLVGLNIKDDPTPNATSWCFIDPNGKTYITKHLSNFCKEHNLCVSTMSKVGKGTRKQHKKWRKS